LRLPNMVEGAIITLQITYRIKQWILITLKLAM
jgi:hypothetical protein